jgi:hypothetical protein
MDLSEARINEVSALFVALDSGQAVRTHSVRRKEERVAITASADYHGMSRETLQLTGHHDTAGAAIDDNQVEHLSEDIQWNISFVQLTAQCRFRWNSIADRNATVSREKGTTIGVVFSRDMI